MATSVKPIAKRNSTKPATSKALATLAATGKSLPEVVRERLTDKLGLADTGATSKVPTPVMLVKRAPLRSQVALSKRSLQALEPRPRMLPTAFTEPA